MHRSKQIFTLKPPCKQSLVFCSAMGCLLRSRVLRGPHLVGSATGRDFPSPLVRFLLWLGIEPNVCPPHRPEKNAFVERSHRTSNKGAALPCLCFHLLTRSSMAVSTFPTSSARVLATQQNGLIDHCSLCH